MKNALKLSLVPAALAAPVQLIIDTDLGFDVDDVGAIAVGNYLQDFGYAEILGFVHCTAFYKGIGGVDVINNYYGRKNLEYGAYKDQWGSSNDAQWAQDSYTSKIEGDYPSEIQNYDQVYDDVTAYKKMLNKAENGTVVIASIGEPVALRNILMAEPELFISKVKEIHYMDGGYNFGCGDSDGSGWSPWLGSTEDCDGAAQYVLDNIPHSIKQVFSLNGGDEETGSRFQEDCGGGPVREAYQTWTNYGTRPSWDLISVYMAVMGTNSLWSEANDMTVDIDYWGHEYYDYGNTGNNEYQVWIDGDHTGDATRVLDDILCSNPCRSDQDVGGCAGYELQASKNCYPGHGAENLDDGSIGLMTLAQCMAECDGMDGCEGVSVTATDEGMVECYRKGDIDIGDCDWYPPVNTYTKK